jgi:L-amino acid N-acyltransferase YncA
MIIRQAQSKDFPHILRIYNQAVRTGGLTGDEQEILLAQRLPWLEQHTGEHYMIFVAEHDSASLGYLALSPYRHGRSAFYHTAEVSYYIDESHRRQGLAAELMEHALAACEGLQFNTLIAILLSGNQASIALLKKFGFSRWGCMPQIARFKNDIADHLYFGKQLCEN